MTPSRDDAPRGRLRDVPPVVRHLWSLLYRSVRRHAERLDRLRRALNALGGDVNSLHAALVQLEDDVRALNLRADALDAELDELRLRVRVEEDRS